MTDPSKPLPATESESEDDLSTGRAGDQAVCRVLALRVLPAGRAVLPLRSEPRALSDGGMSCATDGCSDPNCGPCTIYERFPNLREYERQRKRPTRSLVQSYKGLPLKAPRKKTRK